jgi:hypothetical protein
MFPILFFTTSLILVAGFLFVKVRRFNAGEAEHHAPHIVEAVKEDLKIVHEQVKHHAKRSFKKAIFTVGRIWIVLVYLGEKKLRKHFPKLFPKAPEPGQKPSFFLSTIMEYKMRMKHFKKKIREEDEKEEEE